MSQPPDSYLRATVAAIQIEVTRVVRSRDVREEEDYTSRLLAAIESGLARVGADALEWTSAVLRKQTEEPRLGADFAGVLRIRHQGYDVGKGFLVQSKLVGRGKSLDKRRLLAQSRAMLNVTPASYVFLYGRDGITVVPAIAVVAAGGDPRGLSSWDYTTFFLEHFRCFVGDASLRPTQNQTLGEFLESLPARRLAYMDLRSADDESFAARISALHASAAGAAGLHQNKAPEDPGSHTS